MIEAESEHGSDGVRLLAADLKGYHHGMGLGDKAAPNRMFIFPYAWGHFGPGTRFGMNSPSLVLTPLEIYKLIIRPFLT